MWTNRSPPKTPYMAPTSGLVGFQQRPDENVGASDNTPSKDTQFGQPTNQMFPPPGYSYLPSRPLFPGASQFYHHAPFNLTPSSQPSTGVTQGYASHRPSWQAYDSPQGGYGGPQMFPTERFTGNGRPSPGAPRVPPAMRQTNPVIKQTSFTSTAPGQRPGAPGTRPVRLPTRRFQPTAEPRRTDIAGIANMLPLPEISYDEYDADYESNDSSDLGGANDTATISMKQMEFSLKPFGKGWGSPALLPSTSGREYGWLGF